MPRHRKILAAVDGSEAGFHALKESIRLAQWGKGGVTAIAVAPSYDGDLSLVGVRSPKAVIRGRSEEVLGRAVEIAETQGFRIDVICEEGEAHYRIAARAEAGGFDCIVLGAAPEKSFLERLVPAVSAKVAAIGLTDVLILPQGKELRWDRILFVSEASGENAGFAASALELAHSYGAALEAMQTPRSKIRAPGWRACGAICAAAARLDASIIVVGCDKMTKLRRFGKSLLARIALESQLPVYVIKSGGRPRPAADDLSTQTIRTRSS